MSEVKFDEIEFREIPRFPGYFASECGRIVSNRKNKLQEIKGSVSRYGYHRVCLRQNGDNKFIFVHRLVYQTFGEKVPDGLDIDHIDRNRLNNNFSNLRVATRSENLLNRDNSTLKLSENNVREIRKRFIPRMGLMSSNAAQLAKEFNVDPSAIRQIANNKIRKSV